MSVAINNELSEKCKKDIAKFCEWAQERYIVEDMDGVRCEWSVNIVSYEEPSRNKIEKFVEKVLGMYSIMDEDANHVEDFKLLVAEYKGDKPKTIRKKKEIETKIEVKESIVDWNVDASDDGPHRQIYCDTLDYSYDELKSIFGEAKKMGGDGEHWRYTWILKYNNIVYSIYDWSETYIFEDIIKCEWHIASESGEWSSMKKYLSEKLGNRELKAEEFENID